MKAIERLEELLNQKDAEIEKLSEELGKAKDELYYLSHWTKHSEGKESDLPVPRLQIRFCDNAADSRQEWDEYKWDYKLIYRHFLGHIVEVPLGRTTTSGVRGVSEDDDCPLPFRDGAHIANDSQTLKLPAYAIFGKKVQLVFFDSNGKIQQSNTHFKAPSED